MSILSSVSFYPVTNIEATMEFYCEGIGLTLYHDQGKAKLLDTGYGYWGFVEYDDRLPHPEGLCLSLNCESNEDVDLQYHRLLKKGIVPIAPPVKHPKFDVYSFFVKDPDGYMVEFQKIEHV